MNKIQDLVRNFENHVSKVNSENPEFFQAVEEIAKAYGYPLSNAAVFNRNLLKITNLKYILVADNPGMTEQHEECYLVGKAGKTARNFFKNNGLVSDFDEEVAVLNKTFIHTKSTLDLKKLKNFKSLFEDSEKFTANLAVDMLEATEAELWITGCSELGEKKLFSEYLKTLKSRCAQNPALKKRIFFYPHFSFGNFSKNLNSVLAKNPEMSVKEALKAANLDISVD
ncbi:hypothetical protein J6W78_04420 [bacterium]|nr:hypothetical protein [bacterium]